MVDKNNPQIDNEYIRDLLSSYLDDEVSEAERAMVERAVAESDELQAELDSLRQTVTLLSNLPPMPAPRPFTLSQADVEPVVSPAQPAKKRNWFSWWLGGFSAAVAALLCVVVIWNVVGLGNLSSSEVAMAPDADNAAQQQVETAADEAEEPAQESMAVEVVPTMTIPIAEEAQAAELVEPEVEAEALEAETGPVDEAADENLFSTEPADVPASEPAQESAAESQLNEIPATSTPASSGQARVAPPAAAAETVEEAEEASEEASPVEPEMATLAMEEEEASEEAAAVESDVTIAEDGSAGEDEVSLAEELPAESEAATTEEAMVDEDEATTEELLPLEAEEATPIVAATPPAPQSTMSGIGGGLPESETTPGSAQDRVVTTNEEAATEEAMLAAEAEATQMVTDTDASDEVTEEEAEESEALDEETMRELPQEQTAPAGDSEATESTIAPAEASPATEPQAVPPAPEQPESLPQADDGLSQAEEPAAAESVPELMDESSDQPQAEPQTENIPTATPSPLPSPLEIAQATATAVPAATPTQLTQAATPELPSDEQPIPSNILPWLFGLILILLAMLTIVVLLVVLRLNRQS